MKTSRSTEFQSKEEPEVQSISMIKHGWKGTESEKACRKFVTPPEEIAV